MQELQANGIFDGYKNENGNHTGLFGPADELTVSEGLKLALSFNNDIRSYDHFDSYAPEIQEQVLGEIAELKTFLDGDFEVPINLKGHWAEDLFRKAYALKLTIGQDLENLDLDRPITRGEIMELISESLEAEIPEIDEYSLSDIENTKYADLIEYYYQKNYINGYPDGTFKVNGFLNRAEAVKIINNFWR